MGFIRLSKELVDDISVSVKERNYVVDVAFPNEHLYLGYAKLKATAILGPWRFRAFASKSVR